MVGNNLTNITLSGVTNWVKSSRLINDVIQVSMPSLMHYLVIISNEVMSQFFTLFNILNERIGHPNAVVSENNE